LARSRGTPERDAGPRQDGEAAVRDGAIIPVDPGMWRYFRCAQGVTFRGGSRPSSFICPGRSTTYLGPSRGARSSRFALPRQVSGVPAALAVTAGRAAGRASRREGFALKGTCPRGTRLQAADRDNVANSLALRERT